MKTTESIVIDGYDLLAENERLSFEDVVVCGHRLNRATATVPLTGTPHADYADVKADGTITTRVVDEALRLEGVDRLGLDELDRSYLKTIATVYKGGPVGLETVAATMNEDSGTLEDVVEPFLLQIGFLARTRRGRAITKVATDHLGLPWIEPKPAANGSLF